MSWKSKWNIPFLFLKIFHKNPPGNHDVPARQNTYNWTFSGTGRPFYPIKCIFQCDIMFKNQNEKKNNQINWFLSVSPWFIKNGPRETIPCTCWFWTLLQIFLTTNHYRYDKQDQYCGSQWKHKLWKQPKWKTYFCTMSPRDKYDKCGVLVQTGSKIRPNPSKMHANPPKQKI